jgi:hypothetical protein
MADGSVRRVGPGIASDAPPYTWYRATCPNDGQVLGAD